MPLNYNYAVASLIYNTLGNSSIDFAARLHDEGFSAEGRKFKLFTFSRLAAHRSVVKAGRLLLEDPTVSLQISSPVAEFIEHFVSGLFRSESFEIAGSRFSLTQAKTLAPPDFAERMSFRARQARRHALSLARRRLVCDHLSQPAAQIPGATQPRSHRHTPALDMVSRLHCRGRAPLAPPLRTHRHTQHQSARLARSLHRRGQQGTDCTRLRSRIRLAQLYGLRVGGINARFKVQCSPLSIFPNSQRFALRCRCHRVVKTLPPAVRRVLLTIGYPQSQSARKQPLQIKHFSLTG